MPHVKLVFHCLYNYCWINCDQLFLVFILSFYQCFNLLAIALIGSALSLESCIISFIVIFADYVCLYQLAITKIDYLTIYLHIYLSYVFFWALTNIRVVVVVISYY